MLRRAPARLRDAEAPAELHGRGAARADRLEDEAVHRAQLGLPCAGKLGVDRVDEHAERAEQSQRQLVAGPASSSHTLDNLVDYKWTTTLTNHIGGTP